MLYIGSDHAGFKLKERIKLYLKKKKIKFVDIGNKHYDSDDDYPDFGYKLAKKIKKTNKGILICGSSFYLFWEWDLVDSYKKSLMF